MKHFCPMFEGPEYPVSLSEDQFDQWLIKGRESKIGYEFMLVIWNDLEQAYYPVYAENLEEVYDHGRNYGGGSNPEGSLVAAYHLYSESKINPYSN